MLNSKVEVISTSQYTTPKVPVNRQFKNNADLDVIIYTINHKLTIAERLVLVALCSFSEKYGEFRARIDTIARMAGVSHVTVTRSLKKLFQLNYVRRWSFGGTPRYIDCDEIQSANYTKSGSEVSFYLGNEPEINKNIYIYTREVPRFKSLSWDERLWWGTKREYAKSNALMAVALPMAMQHCLLKKGEKQLNKSMLIPEFIENITEVELTFDDKLELAVFAGPIIDLARKRVASSGNLTNPTAYFKAICRKEHQQRLQNNKPSFFKKPTARQPSVKPQLSRLEYARIKYGNTKYLWEMTINPEAKARLFTQMQEQANKIADLDDQEPTRNNDTIAASWQKSPEELAEMKARGLANVKDQGMREYLAALFDASVNQYSSCAKAPADRATRDKTSRPETPVVLPEVIKNSNIAPEFDVEIDEYDYDPINTHNLFG